MAEKSDIRVRLSPEGEKDVIEALRAVQREANRAAKSGAGGVGLTTAALAELHGLLPKLGLAAAVTGIVSLGRHALRSADEIGKMGQRVGASAENVSALVFAAATADVSNEQLTRGLGFLAKSLGDLNRGVGEQVDLFGELGLSAKDFAGKDTVQAFALVSERLGAIDDGSKKTELSLRILGRGAQGLIPLMNDLAERGFASVYAEAQKLGLIFTSDLARSAQQARDSMTLVGKQVEGLAVQFAAGLAPAIVESMTKLREETGGGLDAFKTLGEFVGRVANGIVVSWLLAGAAIGFVIALIEEKARNLKALGTDVAAGAAGGALKGGPMGAILGAAKALFKPSPDSKAQLAIFDQFLEKIDEITRKIDPAEIAKRAKTLQDIFDDIGKDINLSDFEKTQKRLVEITKRAGLEQIGTVVEIAKQRREAAEKGAQSEEASLKARLAATGNLLSSQQRVEQSEIAAIGRRVSAAKAAFQAEIALAKDRENALIGAARHQFGETVEGQRVIEQIVKQSNQEQLKSGKALFDALNAEQVNYLNRSKAAQEKIVALNKEIADSRKQAAEFVRDIERQNLSDEQKISLVRRDALENEARLRDAVLAGDVLKQQELRAETFKLAQELKQLGAPAIARQIVEEGQHLFELGAAARVSAAQAAAKTAEDGAAAVRKQIEEIRLQVDQLEASLLVQVKLQPEQASLRDMRQAIQDELRSPFQIAVTPVLGTIVRSGNTFSDVAGFAAGGRIPGLSPTWRADDKLIRATSGEFMQPVRAVEYYGLDFMEQIRRMELPRFAEGGLVGGSSPARGGGEVVDLNLNRAPRSVRVSTARESVRDLVEMLNELADGVEG